MLLPKTKRPAGADEKLETFLMWAEVDQRPAVSRGLRRLAFATAAICALVIAVNAGGWI